MAGAAVGALAGILFAPEKGRKIRKKIMQKGEDSLDCLSGKLEKLLKNFTDEYNDARHDLENFVSKEKRKYEEMKKEAKIQ